MKGLFIAFEGIDCSGKSTLATMLKKYYEESGKDVVLTREPGGTPIGEKIRNILKDVDNSEMTPMTEVLLFAASRAQHVETIIRPALESGKIVICDRYVDSSIAYQGFAENIGMFTVTYINDYAIDGLYPDITFFIDIPAETSINRINSSRDARDRLEMDNSIIDKRREGFYQIYQKCNSVKTKPHRNCIIIDGTKSIDEIFETIISHL